MPLGWLHFFGNWNYTVVTFKTFLLEILAISCLLCPDLAAWEVTNLYSISGLLINAASQQIALKRKWLSQEGILCCQEKKWLFLNKPTLWFGLTFLPLMHSGEVNQGTIYLECVWWRSACFYMRVPWRRWFMRGEHLFRDHLCASRSVCVCVCGCLSTPANSNKQAVGQGVLHMQHWSQGEIPQQTKLKLCKWYRINHHSLWDSADIKPQRSGLL